MLCFLMDKLQLTGRALGQVFNFRSGCMHSMHLPPSVAIQPNLELKTQPKQLLGSLPLVIALPGFLLQRLSIHLRPPNVIRLFTFVIYRFFRSNLECLSQAGLSSISRKHKTKLKRSAWEKYIILIQKSITYRCKKAYKIGPRRQCHQHFHCQRRGAFAVIIFKTFYFNSIWHNCTKIWCSV